MPASWCVIQGCSNHSLSVKDGISLQSSIAGKQSDSRQVRQPPQSPRVAFGISKIHFEISVLQDTYVWLGSRRTLIPGTIPTIWKPKSELLELEFPAISSRDRRI